MECAYDPFVAYGGKPQTIDARRRIIDLRRQVCVETTGGQPVKVLFVESEVPKYVASVYAFTSSNPNSDLGIRSLVIPPIDCEWPQLQSGFRGHVFWIENPAAPWARKPKDPFAYVGLAEFGWFKRTMPEREPCERGTGCQGKQQNREAYLTPYF
jgi:hypothetical protein